MEAKLYSPYLFIKILCGLVPYVRKVDIFILFVSFIRVKMLDSKETSFDLVSFS